MKKSKAEKGQMSALAGVMGITQGSEVWGAYKKGKSDDIKWFSSEEDARKFSGKDGEVCRMGGGFM